MRSSLNTASLLLRKKTPSLLVEDSRPDLLPAGPTDRHDVRITVAEPGRRRGLIDTLLRATATAEPDPWAALAEDRSPHGFTLEAADDDAPIGRLGVSLDGPRSLPADDAFGPELNALRRQGRRLCQFTRLGFDPTTASLRVLGRLFHLACLVAHRQRGFDTLLIEVAPRQVLAYEHMLGLHVIGSQRVNWRSRAPAVLLSGAFATIGEQMALHAERADGVTAARSLLPFGYAPPEEMAVLARLRALPVTSAR